MERRFPGVALLQQGRNQWSDRIFGQIRHQSAGTFHNRGEPTADRNPSIVRKILIGITTFLLAQGTSMSYFLRALFVTLYLVLGRASETALLCFGLMSWDPSLNALTFPWKEFKTGKEAPVSMFPDRTNFEMDFYHCIARHLIVNPVGLYATASAELSGIQFVSPQLHSSTAGDDNRAAQKITGWLRWIAKERGSGIKWFHDGFSSHGFRHGGVDDLSIKEGNYIVAIISRANWDWTGQVRQRAFALLYDY